MHVDFDAVFQLSSMSEYLFSGFFFLGSFVAKIHTKFGTSPLQC